MVLSLTEAASAGFEKMSEASCLGVGTHRNTQKVVCRLAVLGMALRHGNKQKRYHCDSQAMCFADDFQTGMSFHTTKVLISAE